MAASELIAAEDSTELSKTNGIGSIAVSSRVAQEIQGAVLMARNFPRDMTAARTNILEQCKRRSFAEISQYAYPRGGATITGPSIRMAEVLAQSWGNVDFGFTQLSRTDRQSEVMAYCWDLETNSRRTQTFTVRHWRDTKTGGYWLKDERDIYEHVANYAARRLRACILAVIPRDLVEDAVDMCNKTMKGANSEPIMDRANKLVAAFHEQAVSQEMLEAFLGHKVSAVSEIELARLRKIYLSIKDGIGGREDYFTVGEAPSKPTGDGNGSNLNDMAAETTEDDDGDDGITDDRRLFSQDTDSDLSPEDSAVIAQLETMSVDLVQVSQRIGHLPPFSGPERLSLELAVKMMNEGNTWDDTNLNTEADDSDWDWVQDLADCKSPTAIKKVVTKARRLAKKGTITADEFGSIESAAKERNEAIQ